MFKKDAKFYQQGDVLKIIDTMPAGAKKINPASRGWVLAEGEATGHAHAVTDTDTCEMYELDGVLYLRALKDTVVRHEEHGKIELPEGDYYIGTVREYDHFAEEVRNVAD